MRPMTEDRAVREEPRLERSIRLDFIGDWGQANFHRICSWLCQEVCDRAGNRSRVAIWNTVGGGADALIAVFDGEVNLCIATPAHILPSALKGEGVFQGRALSSLRALAVLPQTDRMVFAIDPKFGVRTFDDLRRKRLPLRIATSPDDGVNLIGYVAARYLEAHGVDRVALESWGGSLVTAPRPEQSVARMERGEVDAVLQEAFMTPWWRKMLDARSAIFLGAEEPALARLEEEQGWPRATIPANYWPGQSEPLPALDFSDFVVLVRDDMAEDIAYLLTWCIVETREAIERQYRHIPPERSPLTYPLVPANMAKAPIPLHAGASRYYANAGLLPQKSASGKEASGSQS
jgi:uncharacterized protein